VQSHLHSGHSYANKVHIHPKLKANEIEIKNVGIDIMIINICYPSWIRTNPNCTKNSCATATPSDNLKNLTLTKRL